MRLLPEGGGPRLAGAVLLAVALGGCDDLLSLALQHLVPPGGVLPGYTPAGEVSGGRVPVREVQTGHVGWLDRDGALVVAPRFSDVGRFSEGLAPAAGARSSGWGFVDAAGAWVVPPRYDMAQPFSEGLAAVRVGGLWGYVERRGQWRVPPRFDDAHPFRAGRARVLVAGRWGYLDRQGRWVARPTFHRATDFAAGVATVCEAARCGVLDEAGRVVGPRRFEDIGPFAEGLAAARQGGRWGYVDRRGAWVLTPRYDEAAPFSEGLARVGRWRRGSDHPVYGGYTGERLFHGFIDAAGRERVPLALAGATSFQGGLARVQLHQAFTTDATVTAFLRWDGTLGRGRWDQAGELHEGRAWVAWQGRTFLVDASDTRLLELPDGYGVPSEAEDRTPDHLVEGFLDRDGREVIAPRFVQAQDFSEGLAFVNLVVGPDGRVAARSRGWLDRRGRLVAPMAPPIAPLAPLSEGLAPARGPLDAPAPVGFLDRRGAWVVTPRFKAAGSFSEGLAAAMAPDVPEERAWGYVDRRSRWAVSPRFRAAGPFSHGLAYVEAVTGGRILRRSLVGPDGRERVQEPELPALARHLFSGTPPHAATLAAGPGGGLVPVRIGPRLALGWVDVGGRARPAPPAWEALLPAHGGRAPVAVRGGEPGATRWGLLDDGGRLVVPPRFTRVARFSEGLAAARDEVGRWGWITPDGRWAIPPAWLDEAGAFHEGRAAFALNGRWGYLDRAGRWVVLPRYVRAADFSGGLARVASTRQLVR